MRVPLLLLALLALAGLAEGDHAFSHRYLTLVHVTGPNGAAVANAPVEVAYTFAYDGSCAVRTTAFGAILPSTTGHTDADGFVAFCAHAHAVAGTESVTVRSGNLTGVVRIDGATRVTTARLVDPAGPEGESARLLLHARIFRNGPTTLEGVSVRGLAGAGAPVRVDGTFSDGTPLREAATADSYGDVFFRVAHPAGADGATATWTSGNATRPDAIVAAHRGFASVAFPDDPSASALVVAPDPDSTPGGRTAIPAPAILALAALAMGALRRAR